MDVIVGLFSDAGTCKQQNEDSLLLEIADTCIGTIVLAVVCDGMGGLQKGEVASASVILAFQIWFQEELKGMLAQFSLHRVQCSWELLLREQNEKIRNYGKGLGIHLGTTVTALLLVGDGSLLIGHVGDSRIYEIEKQVRILTLDQTLVALEVRRGRLTAEEAKNDPRQHILLQCIGESKSVKPEFTIEKIKHNCTYMLCSDGFRHKISKEEIYKALQPLSLFTENQIEEQLEELAKLSMSRKEKDNISAIAIRTL